MLGSIPDLNLKKPSYRQVLYGNLVLLDDIEREIVRLQSKALHAHAATASVRQRQGSHWTLGLTALTIVAAAVRCVHVLFYY